MKFLQPALIRICFFFVAGILGGFFIAIPLVPLFLAFVVMAIIFFVAFFWARQQLFPDLFFGISCFGLFFLLGMLVTKLHLPENQPQHYIHQLSPEDKNEEIPVVHIVVKEKLKPSQYNNKFIAEVKKIDSHPVRGKILILTQKDRITNSFDVDDKLLISAAIEEISPPLNPFQYDYRRYMKTKGIYGQVLLQKEEYLKLSSEKTSLRGVAEAFRSKIISKLQQHQFEKDELGIIQALLLGQKEDISEEVYETYAAAGVIHILAVSGLHVGLILLILHWLLLPLEKIKYGKTLKLVLLLLLLWGFAVLAGLSPSVVRAVTMFSFVAVGLQMKRKTSVLNTLFISLFFLLMIKPSFVFDVGFQLSYAAVLAIVIIQPLIYKLLEPKWKVLKYFWGLFSVTLTAQIGVLPLSLFYFHQFPGLFFISNLVILPFLGFILGLGIFVIILALLEILPDVLADFFGNIIKLLNNFVGWIAKQEDFLFQEIVFSQAELFGFYLLIICTIILLKSFTYKKLQLVFVSVIILQLIYYHQEYKMQSNELIIFHKSRSTMVATRMDEHLRINYSSEEKPTRDSRIRNYKLNKKINKIAFHELENVYFFQEEVLFVVDSAAIYPIQNLTPEYILLINSPKINLDRLLSVIQPKVVIADGSNYRSLIQHWKESCQASSVSFHYTGEKGAFILEN